MRRLYATAAIGAAPIAGLALVPSADDHPSGLFILRNIPGGVFGGIYASFRHYTQSAHQPSASYEAHATTSNGVNVHLVGTSHTNPRSAEAAHAAITSHANASSLAAVAVECDAQTLALVRCAHEAIEGLPIERVKSEGLGVVREALWNSKTVRDMAEKEGKELESPASIGLPPALTHHLTNDGVLWGDEMRAAADAADAAGVRVVCLDSTASTAAANATPPSKLGMIAFWLRAYALHPGVDEKSCDEATATAVNNALRETMPRTYAELLAAKDERMATALQKLCILAAGGHAALPRATDASSGRQQSVVVAVVGMGHVSGLSQLLDPSRKSET